MRNRIFLTAPQIQSTYFFWYITLNNYIIKPIIVSFVSVLIGLSEGGLIMWALDTREKAGDVQEWSGLLEVQDSQKSTYQLSPVKHAKKWLSIGMHKATQQG